MFNSTSLYCIRDEFETLTYQNLLDETIDFEWKFGEIPKNSCICIEGQNNLLFVRFLIHCLLTKRSLFISSVNSIKNLLPSFCNYKIELFKDSKGVNVTFEPINIDLNTTLSGEALYLSTSGTTGDPKYICFNYNYLLQNALLCKERFGICSGTRVLLCVPIYHMYGLGAGLLPSLLANANIVLVDNYKFLKFIEELQTFNPEIVFISPTQARLLVKLNKTFGRLTFVCAGGKLSEEEYTSFNEQVGELIILYGCSELGGIATSIVTDDLALKRIGALFPLSGVEIFFQGQNGNEIYCKHPAPFRGYVDKLGISQYVFNESDTYKTQDIGVQLENRRFKVEGRKSNILNRSGFTISIEELEFFFSDNCNNVQYVILFEISNSDRIVSDLVLVYSVIEGVDDIELVEEEVQVVSNRLPKHFRPSKIVRKESLPINGSGKIDRQKLINSFNQ
ncbi:AMP-binding protein [Sphingobacterium siyangense]|uniref:AMP-binding protein n=1 Tax=Sphingobacterium siyangense TaxID=459529 RepID=UPI0028A28A55|nr:AMP-binding protein [Sphingobacterium siyangense]